MLSSDIIAPSSTSPRSEALFSDDPHRASSPPSSPPGFPWEQQQQSQTAAPSPSTRTVKSAFSLLGKRKALSEIGENARPARKPALAPTKKTIMGTQSLTQMQISLGQAVQKKCKVCGMEYVASSAEDRKLHEKYHKQNAEGYDLGKNFVQSTSSEAVFEGAGKGDRVVRVDCDNRVGRKRRAQDCLEIVQRALGAVAIPEQDIWQGDGKGEARYSAYLYVRKTKCVGFMLTESIHEARRVVEPRKLRRDSGTAPASGTKGSSLSTLKARKQAAELAAQEAANHPIELSEDSEQAKLGISRIWTSATYRQQGIAKALLDAAMLDYDQRVNVRLQARASNSARDVGTGGESGSADKVVEIDGCKLLEKLRGKEDVAFSQPTEAGARLARKWFGMLYAWHVYVD